MSVTDVTKDAEARTMTVRARFDAPAERVWAVWSDPRQLERWWGPPSFPATVVDHELAPGGSVTYFMTSPEGERFHGYWRVQAVEAPHALEFEDGFADASGAPNDDLPVTRTRVELSESGGATEMRITTHFPSQEAMDKMLEMQMEEGMRQAVGQIDDLLAPVAS